MARYQCKSCEGTYESPQRDGASYFHSCAPIHNPEYDAQFTVDANGDLIAQGEVDPDIPEMLEHPDRRDENVVRQSDGKMSPKREGKGRETLLVKKG
jgi:hypothetical protein